jgi:biotin transporter BioY
MPFTKITMPVTPEKNRSTKPTKATKRPSHAVLFALTWMVGLGVLALGAAWMYWFVVIERNDLPWGALLLIPCVAVIAAVTFRNHFSGNQVPKKD